MMRNPQIKKVFDEKFNSMNMRNEILERYNKKGGFMIKTLKYALPVCLVILICGAFIMSGDKPLKKDSNTENIGLNINNVDEMGQLRYDADIRVENEMGIFMPWYKELSDLYLPKGLDEFYAYRVYTKNDKNSEYDVLNCDVYSYSDDSRSVRIALSDTNKPIRDYYFDEVGEYSIINNKEVTIYQYGDTYYTEFVYNNYNFDIETSGITPLELKLILESIIK